MNGLTIIPECYIDTCLTETITNCFNKFNHQKSCNKVSSIMQNKFKDSFALGIVDKDKHEIAYIKEFNLIASKDSIYLYKHSVKHHYIIQIYPAMERFFLKAAEEKDINISDYGLPSEFKSLIRITKSISEYNEENFKKLRRLFRDLTDAPELIKLANLILYMGNQTYNIDPEELKRILH